MQVLLIKKKKKKKKDPFKCLCTHLVCEQFEFFADVQQPGRQCVDLFPERIIVNTSSPKKASKSFKAWVDNRFLNSYHHLPYLDTHTLSILNAPSSWWCTPWALSWAPRRLFCATPFPDAFDGRRQA